MFHHGLYGNGSSISGETLRLLKTRIRTSNTLNELLKKEIKKAKSKNKNSFTIERTGKKSLEFTARKDKDLYYSLQNVSCKITCTKKDKKRWYISLHLWDTYDFTDFSRTLREGITVGNVANDFGVLLQKTKFLKPYDISVYHSFTITV